MTPAELWSDAVGLSPWRVTVYENAEKQNVVYLRWRAGGNWKKRSLSVLLRDDRGRIRADIKRMVLAEAERQYELLSGKRAPDTARSAPLTIAGAWAVVSDPATGLYPVKTRHARQVALELTRAARIWGATTTWDNIDRSRIRMLGRTRVDEIRANVDPNEKKPKHRGIRGAIETVRSVLTVAAWLRDESKIASDACLTPRSWRAELREYWRQVAPSESATPERPRHTIVEMRELLRVAPDVDPRLALLLALGAELRAGQVLRCRRSDISAEHKTLTVHDAGKKGGEVVELTAGQWAAWEHAISTGEHGEPGYLSECETQLPDYPLFPRGRLIKGLAEPQKHGASPSIDRGAVQLWFKEAEAAAGITTYPGVRCTGSGGSRLTRRTILARATAH